MLIDVSGDTGLGFVNVLGGRHSSGCSRLKLMISASECILVVLKSRINSVRHSLNSESTQDVSGLPGLEF
jgi:hypothetical protein